MSTRKWVDKKTATTYKVVHRGHDDPRYHDTDASEHVLLAVENPNNKKIKTKEVLESELGDQLNAMRVNEGEAALYGITFDDSKYDYMQHLKPMGQGDGVFIAKRDEDQQQKSNNDKKKNNSGITFKEDLKDIMPPEHTVKLTYQDQQAVPDEIAGFQPDMNPALREVLEALEDEAYVEEDDDIFESLLEDGELIDEDKFQDQIEDWDLDNYDDEFSQYDDKHFEQEGDQGWEADFRKYKALSKKKQNDWDSEDEFEGENDEPQGHSEEDDDFVPELPSLDKSTAASAAQKSKKGAKQKARKKMGAQTDLSSYSLSSSALYRSEGLRLIDDKFEVMKSKYENSRKEQYEEDENKKPFDFKDERADLEDMLDDFLDNHVIEGGRRLVKKNPELDALKVAADSVSRGKLAKKRNKQRGVNGLTSSLGNLKI